MGVLGLAALAFVRPSSLCSTRLCREGGCRYQHDLSTPPWNYYRNQPLRPCPEARPLLKQACLSVRQSIQKATTTDPAALDAQVTANGDISAYLIVEGDKASTATSTYPAKDPPVAAPPAS